MPAFMPEIISCIKYHSSIQATFFVSMLWLGFTRQEANTATLARIYWPALYSRAYNHNPNKPSLSLIS
jgi:hypothetical protein